MYFFLPSAPNSASRLTLLFSLPSTNFLPASGLAIVVLGFGSPLPVLTHLVSLGYSVLSPEGDLSFIYLLFEDFSGSSTLLNVLLILLLSVYVSVPISTCKLSPFRDLTLFSFFFGCTILPSSSLVILASGVAKSTFISPSFTSSSFNKSKSIFFPGIFFVYARCAFNK